MQNGSKEIFIISILNYIMESTNTSHHIQVGISCDHCDYINMNVMYCEFESYVGKPCPKCGQNLLTREDCDAMKARIQRISVIERLQREGVIKTDQNSPEVFIGFKFDTKGNMIPLNERERKIMLEKTK